MSISLSELEAMKKRSRDTIDKDSLVDIQNVEVNSKLPVRDRVFDFIRQIKNPYIFRFGKTTVRISYADTEETFEEIMKGYFENL